MVHTVGLVGINGNVGAPLAQLLICAAHEGKINLVLFHRESSNTSNFAPGNGVELRLLSFDDSVEKIQTAVKGVNVFVSAVGVSALTKGPKLVEALAKSPDLVTHIPPSYSTTWSEADLKDPDLGPLLDLGHAGFDLAKKLGLSTTLVYTGVFDLYVFELDFLLSPLKGNTIWANKEQLKRRVPITEMNHLAANIARIATSDPETIKNKEFSVVSFWPSGQELAELYSKINGKPAQFKDWTAADRELLKGGAALHGAVRVGYLDKWAGNKWEYEKGGKIQGEEYRGPSLEDVARRFL